MTEVVWNVSRRALGGDPNRGYRFDLVADAEGYAPGGRDIDNEAATQVAAYLDPTGWSITAPASMSSAEAVFDLCLERAKHHGELATAVRSPVSEAAEWYHKRLLVVPGLPVMVGLDWLFMFGGGSVPLLVRLLVFGGVAFVDHLIEGLGLAAAYGNNKNNEPSPADWMLIICWWAFIIEFAVVLVRGLI